MCPTEHTTPFMRAIGRLAAYVMPSLPGALMHDVLRLAHESERTACVVGIVVTLGMFAVAQPWRRDVMYNE